MDARWSLFNFLFHEFVIGFVIGDVTPTFDKNWFIHFYFFLLRKTELRCKEEKRKYDISFIRFIAVNGHFYDSKTNPVCRLAYAVHALGLAPRKLSRLDCRLWTQFYHFNDDKSSPISIHFVSVLSY